MTERKVKEELATIRDDRSRRRRAKRGLVAGYIHELSVRHASAARTAARPQQPTGPVPEATAGV